MPSSKSHVVETPGFKAGPPPKEAVEWLKGKGVKPAESWQATWDREYRYAFYIARMTEKDLIKDVRDSLDDALEQGVPFREWAKDPMVRETFDKSGWADYNGQAEDSPSRLRTVFDTNCRTARMAGQLERQEQVRDLFPYAEFNLGPSKIHREEHIEWEGLVVRVAGAFFQAHFTPLGFGCKCWWRFMTKAEADELGVATEPDFDYVEWENDEGHKALAPEGVQPGFGENPLRAREGQLQKLEQEQAADAGTMRPNE